MSKEKELGSGSYSARTVAGGILLQAEGMTPTPNYTVWLEKGMIDVFPPEYSLFWIPPEGMQVTMLASFQADILLKTDQGIAIIVVHDADGEHLVPVTEGAA